ncbi:MAG: type II toxin-antitoxin system VapC family toxin [Ferrimicrobium sp.]
MILADTSAWVEYDRATGSRVDQRLMELISGDGPLAVTEPVIMEIVAGTRTDERESDLRRLLLRFPLLGFDAGIDFEAAARIFRQCRRAGITPRGMVDCMIASVAHRHGASLLTFDVDLSRVAKIVQIDLDDASIAP